MSYFKKILTLVLVVCMMFTTLSLVACNKDKNKDNGSSGGGTNNNNENDNTKTTYTAVFVDSDGNPVEGVTAMATTGTKFSPRAASGADGVATFDCSELGEGTVYIFIIKVPDGYIKPETEESTSYHATYEKGVTTTNVTIEKKPDESVAYSVTVVDQYGNPVIGATVIMCTNLCSPGVLTDENGKASNNYAPGSEVHVKIEAPSGYSIPQTPDADGYIATIGEGNTEIVITKN